MKHDRLITRSMKAVLLVLTLYFLISCSQFQPAAQIYERTSPYSFDDTLLNLDIAISEQNYRIIHRSHIGQAVRDRGDDDFPLATITNFCNITYAKEMMQINPQLINEMPCFISVRQSGSDGVVVSTKLMDEDVADTKQSEFAKKINLNLKTIIGATIE